MFRKLTVYSIIMATLALLVAACSSTPTSVPAPAPSAASTTSAPVVTATSVPVSPTSAPVAAATSTKAPVTSATAPAGAPATGGTIKLDIVPSKSEARYRVREQLAQVSLPSDAVGKTNAITGSIVGKPDGTISSDQSKFVVDMRTLTSDRAQRDNFLRGQILRTNQYPNATFIPTKATGLPAAFPPTGSVSFKLTGDMTILSMTKPLTWDVQCEPQDTTGNVGLCHATTSFKFEDFGIPQPQVPVVLSVVDNITLELDLTLQRAQ